MFLMNLSFRLFLKSQMILSYLMNHMFLMSRKIKALGVKMVLSGEGSDEVFGGYLYFHKVCVGGWGGSGWACGGVGGGGK